ncbi:MAG: amidohydrolase family protein [Chitinophagaceae bacterium]|nr:amidohydrolase family protein [Chitinophagaceae bacterium]
MSQLPKPLFAIRTRAFTITILVLTSLFASAQNTFIIKDVTVIPMNSEKSIPGQAVVIKDGKITEITGVGKLKPLKEATVINGKGKYLVPGLFDMHAHFFQEQGDHKNTCENELKVMLANGLTTVRILAGHPSYLEARAKVRQGIWKGPELFIASPQFAGRWPWPTDFKNFEVADTKEKAVEAVKKYKQEGYDEIKITFMIKREVYDAIVQTAKEEAIRVVGHVGPEVKLPAALAAGQQIEHMDEFIDMLLPDTSYNHGQSVSDMNIWRRNAWATVPYLDESKIPSLVRSVKDAGVYVTPTNFFFFSSFGHGMTDEEYKQRPDYAYIPANIREERWGIKDRYWKNAPPPESRDKYVYLRKKMTYELWKAGVPLMAGSDSPEWFLVTGFSIHDELETFVKAGLTPFAALQTATIHPARHLGIDKRTGTIEAGKEADLLLLDKNPLEEIRNTRSISGVLASGKWYDKKALEKMLEEAKPEK